MNAEEAIIIVTSMPSVKILLAPINASARQDIPVMVFHAQVLDHFTVTGGNEARFDLALIQPFLLHYVNHIFLMLTGIF